MARSSPLTRSLVRVIEELVDMRDKGSCDFELDNVLHEVRRLIQLTLESPALADEIPEGYVDRLRGAQTNITFLIS